MPSRLGTKHGAPCDPWSASISIFSPLYLVRLKCKDDISQQLYIAQLTMGEYNRKTLLALFTDLKNAMKLDKNQCYELINNLKIVLITLVKNFELCKCNPSEDVDLQHVHDLLFEINRLVPITSNTLMFILGWNFPSHNRDANIQENYVSNLLFIIMYLPFKQKQILDLIIKHIIQLDAHTIIEPELSREKMKLNSKLINTLDTLMECLFNFISDTCYIAKNTD
uniref:Uncharacterized protein n=1 Tax=Strigamia maritima TaxID=126957 RepID=T1IZB3_STRMM